MIEDERDQRSLENWDKRFRQIFGERTQPHSEPGCGNECFGNHEACLTMKHSSVDRALRRAMAGVSRHPSARGITSARSTSQRFTFVPVLVLRRGFDKTGPMAEETIWRGTASQLK